MKEEGYYIDLIYKELEKSITPDEERQLRSWLEASTSNMETRNSIRQVWSLESEAKDTFDVNVSEGFAAVQQKIQNQSAKPISTEKKSSFNLKPWSIAAAVVLILGIGWRYLFKQDTSWETEIASTEVRHIILPDQSEVWLNPGSSVEYPRRFSDNERDVRIQGRAFFDVSKDPSRRFRIMTSACTIEVLGTRFEVWENMDHAQTEVHVKSGRVSVVNNDKSDDIILIAGQGVVCDQKTGALSPENLPAENIDSWTTSRLTFNNTSLTEVFAAVSRHYGVDIQSDILIPSACTLNATFVDEELTTVFEHLRRTLQIEMRQVDQNHYVITKAVCD